jgi:hypothetical protein
LDVIGRAPIDLDDDDEDGDLDLDTAPAIRVTG